MDDISSKELEALKEVSDVTLDLEHVRDIALTSHAFHCMYVTSSASRTLMNKYVTLPTSHALLYSRYVSAPMSRLT